MSDRVWSTDIGRWRAVRAAEMLASDSVNPAVAQVHATLALFWKGESGSFPPGFDYINLGDGSAQEER